MLKVIIYAVALAGISSAADQSVSYEVSLPIKFTAATVQPPGTSSVVVVSFTPQGAQALKDLTGRKIRGVGLVSISACSMSAQAVSGSLIKAWGRLGGIQFIDGPGSSVIPVRAAQDSLAQLGLDLGADAPGIVSALIASKLIKVGSAWGVAAGGGAIAFQILKGRLQSRVPDLSRLVGAMVPATVSIPAGGCATAPGGEYLTLVRFNPKWDYPLNLRCAGFECAGLGSIGGLR